MSYDSPKRESNMRRIADLTREQMRRDREDSGMSIYQIAVKHGVSPSTVFTVVKDCDDSKVPHGSPGHKRVLPVTPMTRPALSKVELGEATRQVIIGRLMWSGVKVFVPLTEDTVIDLIVRRSTGAIVTCQCKYIFPEHDGSHSMNLFINRVNHQSHTSRHHRYTEKEVEVFLGYCQDNDSVYVIPNKKTCGRNEVRFWIMRKRVGSNQMAGFDPEPWRERFDILL
jgi:transposase-like protein/DNA-directed RNA polymerase subunit M/transcription elongation factor TFIIS